MRVPVTDEAGAWLGAAVTVLPGATIGRGAVVGAGTVVTKDVPPDPGDRTGRVRTQTMERLSQRGCRYAQSVQPQAGPRRPAPHPAGSMACGDCDPRAWHRR
ncbi:hypothetical protein [Streptomyces sp. NPDC007100]|uniref:hypothetical protein n=1 Tax=Streptomyces sp. NPDC007100 TaxID=3155602 RepID=UPI0033F4ABDF